MSLAPRDAVLALGRTQLDWIPPTTRPQPVNTGFAAGQDDRGRPLRWLTCPDCLANGFVSTGCETCGGRGELVDPGPDPYQIRAEGANAFYGEQRDQARDHARWRDGQILEIERMARMRDTGEPPEDWFARAMRLKDQQWRRGDYPLLHAAQQLLAASHPLRHLGWVTFVVEQQPLSIVSQARVRLDETAEWLADKMLSAIRTTVVRQQQQADTLGIPERRARVRPVHIVVPVELERELAEAQAGRGRWANGHSQGQRNALVLAMAAEGRTAGEIARRVGVTKRRVQQLLAAMPIASGPAA